MSGPIGLAPFQLITLLSPAFPPSSSAPSSPTKQRPTSPTQLTPSTSLTDRLSTLVSSPQQPTTGGSIVQSSKGGSVRSVDGGGDKVWVGGSDGRVRVYEVGEGEAGEARPLSPSMLSQVGSARLGQAVEEVVVGGGKAVDRLVCLAGIGLAMVLSGERLIQGWLSTELVADNVHILQRESYHSTPSPPCHRWQHPRSLPCEASAPSHSTRLSSPPPLLSPQSSSSSSSAKRCSSSKSPSKV